MGVLRAAWDKLADKPDGVEWAAVRYHWRGKAPDLLEAARVQGATRAPPTPVVAVPTPLGRPAAPVTTVTKFRRTTTQTNNDLTTERALHRAYVDAHKAATSELMAARTGPNCGKLGHRPADIVARCNNSLPVGAQLLTTRGITEFMARMERTFRQGSRGRSAHPAGRCCFSLARAPPKSSRCLPPPPHTRHTQRSIFFSAF